MIVYKALLEGGISPHVKHPWLLPQAGRPGHWLADQEPPLLCNRGFHGWLTVEKAQKTPGAVVVYEMEISSGIVKDYEKAAGRRARLLRPLYERVPEEHHPFGYPNKGTFHGDDGLYVQCVCGHKSYGKFFGAVWSAPDEDDAWQAHKKHMDRSDCRKRRTPRLSGWREVQPKRVGLMRFGRELAA